MEIGEQLNFCIRCSIAFDKNNKIVFDFRVESTI